MRLRLAVTVLMMGAMGLFPRGADAGPRAERHGSFRRGGAAYGGARVNTVYRPAQWVDYGNFVGESEPYGHAYDNEYSAEKRRESDARSKANQNAHKANDNQPARTFSSGPTVDPNKPQLRVSGRAAQGMSQDEAMRSTLGHSTTFAAVDTPKLPPIPPGTVPIGVGDTIYYYSACKYYLLEGGGVGEVEPPEGALVFDLSDAAKTKEVGGKSYYQCGNGWYVKSLFQGTVVYRCVAAPG